MAYVRAKVIHGRTYYYLVEGRRIGNKVVQKHLRYLGSTRAVHDRLTAPSFAHHLTTALANEGKELAKATYAALLHLATGKPQRRRHTRSRRSLKPVTFTQLLKREVREISKGMLKASIDLLLPPPPKRKRRH